MMIIIATVCNYHLLKSPGQIIFTTAEYLYKVSIVHVNLALYEFFFFGVFIYKKVFSYFSRDDDFQQART